MQLTLTMPILAGSHPRTADRRIRTFEPADLEQLADLYYQSYPAGTVADRAEALADLTAATLGHYGVFLPAATLVYVNNHSLLGCVMTVDRPPWSDVSDLVFVIDLFVAPQARGMGIGRKLLTAALGQLPAGRTVGLRVQSENAPALSLYRSLGFRESR